MADVIVPRQNQIDAALGQRGNRRRSAAHHLSLEQRPAVVEAGEFAAVRAGVAAIWDRVMVAGPEAEPV